MSLAYWLREGPAEPVEEGRIQHGPGKGLPKLVFQSLDASRTIVKKIATVDRVRRKIILIQPSDKALYLSGLRERGVPGYVYIFAHARSNSLQGVTRQDIIVDLIYRSGIWHGQPLMIDACNAGAEPDGIASSLALALRTFVTTPTTTTWNYAMGGSAIGQGAFEKLPGVLAGLPFPDLFRPGRWRTWGPDGKPIAITRTSPRDGGELVKGPLADVLMKKP